MEAILDFPLSSNFQKILDVVKEAKQKLGRRYIEPVKPSCNLYFLTQKNMIRVKETIAELSKTLSENDATFVTYAMIVNAAREQFNLVKYSRTLISELFDVELSGEVYDVLYSMNYKPKMIGKQLALERDWKDGFFCQCLYMLVACYTVPRVAEFVFIEHHIDDEESMRKSCAKFGGVMMYTEDGAFPVDVDSIDYFANDNYDHGTGVLYRLIKPVDYVVDMSKRLGFHKDPIINETTVFFKEDGVTITILETFN